MTLKKKIYLICLSFHKRLQKEDRPSREKSKGKNLFLIFVVCMTIYFSQAFLSQPQMSRVTGWNSALPSLEESAEHRETPKECTLLITGCARSGTGFIANFLRANQLDVGHEYDGSYGMAAWTLTGDSDIAPVWTGALWRWGPGANNYSFEHIFHQVRHPLKTIASAGNEPLISWIYIKIFVPEIEMDDPKIVKGAKYWYYWNLLAEQKAEWTYRIEDIENQVGEMMARLEVDLDPDILEKMPTNTNTRRYSDVYTWDDLKQAVDEDLYYKIIAMAIRYGYEIDNF